MTDLATRLSTILRPDPSRTVLRPFSPDDPTGFQVKGRSRVQRVVERVLGLDAQSLAAELSECLNTLGSRHRDVEDYLRTRYKDLDGLITDRAEVSADQALLIGSYFTEEFSFESAALFNPSVVRHPDQAGAGEGGTRILLSLRGIGEGHISSATFRTGTWRADGDVEIDQVSPLAIGPVVDRREMPDGEVKVDLDFSGDVISEIVLFPFMPSQGRGIEDVRLVEFTEVDGSTSYRGTATAFSGMDVRQILLRTGDFRHFNAVGVKGDLYSSKGLALFPRQVNGKYLALSRQDNENIWLTRSDDLQNWEQGSKIITPRHAWEFIQMGNCGSPIEIDEGWLVLTHGVGIVRTYCIGACLLDKDDPTKVLARTPEPILEPSEKDRDGYVPNVVYSCGALVRGRDLLLPYGVADNFTAFATLKVDALLAAMS